MPTDLVCVLVVEDEGLIRMSLVEDLEDSGFQVFEAGDAEEALDVLQGHPEITVLFTDIDMPGSMDGLTLAKLVGQSRPDGDHADIRLSENSQERSAGKNSVFLEAL